MSISLTSIIDGNEEARTFVSVWLSFPVSRYCSRTKRFGSNCLPYAIEQSYYSKKAHIYYAYALWIIAKPSSVQTTEIPRNETITLHRQYKAHCFILQALARQLAPISVMNLAA